MYYDYEKDFPERLAELRQQKKVSAREMSLSLGRNHSYINTIESGKAFPTMKEFFCICDYLNITPKEFFDTKIENPSLSNQLNEETSYLSSGKQQLLLDIINNIK